MVFKNGNGEVFESTNGNGKARRLWPVGRPLTQMVAEQVQRCVRCKVRMIVDAVMATVPDLDARIEDAAYNEVSALVAPLDDRTTAVSASDHHKEVGEALAYLARKQP